MHDQVADSLHQIFRDGQFDLIWSMESGEHMPDKAQFIAELARICRPGGKVLIVTWCHRQSHSSLAVTTNVKSIRQDPAYHGYPQPSLTLFSKQ